MSHQGSYSKLCVVEADTTRLSRLLKPQQSVIGRKKNKRITTFFELNYDIILSFGLTELKAQIAWMENVSFNVRICASSDQCEWARDGKSGALFFTTRVGPY